MIARRGSRIGLTLAVCSAVLVLMSALALAGAPVKSVILMIGDGMGPLQVRMAAEYKGEPLLMQTLPVQAALSTRSADNPVTDSAAAATALATGYKTNNGMIGVTPDGKPKKTILEAAREAGKATGTITTTHPGHATPGGFVAHVRSRSEDTEIVAQAMDLGQDVIMGAGRKLFLPAGQGGSRTDGRNLVAEAQKNGYNYVIDSRGLASVESGKILGLFSTSSSMTYTMERGSVSTEPTIAEMTRKALEVLSSAENGFFLMVEGGKIDTAGHDNDTVNNIGETLAFDEAIAVAVEYVRNHPGTLLVVTADHETGGLTMGETVNGEFLRGFKASTTSLASRVMGNRSGAEAILRDYAGLDSLSSMEKSVLLLLSDQASIKTALNNIIGRRSGFTWTTGGHSATNVPLFAFGAQSEVFAGNVYPNTDVPKRLAQVIGVQLE